MSHPGLSKPGHGRQNTRKTGRGYVKQAHLPLMFLPGDLYEVWLPPACQADGISLQKPAPLPRGPGKKGPGSFRT